jgi:protein glucosyltransferase
MLVDYLHQLILFVIIDNMLSNVLKRLRFLPKRLRLPVPVIVSTFVVLVLLVLAIQNGDRSILESGQNVGRVSKDPRKCFEDNPWIRKSLDHFFKPVKESAEGSDQSAEESIRAMGDIKWGGYSPGQDLVSLVYNSAENTYDVNVVERFPANQPHKSKCIREVYTRALRKYAKYLAKEFDGKEIQFVVTTEDFGIIFRSAKFRLPAFALSTDHEHIDVPVPDFTYGCYPETHYDDDSWEDVRNLLLNESGKLKWQDRTNAIFHRSNWGVGPRRGLMPLLEKMHEDGDDIEILGMPLDVKDTGFVTEHMEQFVPLHEQCKYKSQIHTAGFSYSAGLKYKLACGSLVLKFSSKYEEFYEPGLKDGVHVVKLEASEDGVDKDQFFNVSAPKIKAAILESTEKQSSIAKQGQNFIRQNLTEDALDCYWYGAMQQYGKLYLKHSSNKS